jgi:hypothetical protein
MRKVRPDKGKDGHLRVRIIGGKRELIHRLVLAVFDRNPIGKEQSCHRDGNPLHNYITNLRWGQQSDNWIDSKRHGTFNRHKSQNNHIKPQIQWPLLNCFFGASVEDEKHLYRINALEKIPAAHKFVNLEPLLSDIYIADYLRYLNWVVLGCESLGNRAGRPCELEWIGNIVRQCKEANVPIFIKQLNINGKAEKNMSKFPPDLQIREWPKETNVHE